MISQDDPHWWQAYRDGEWTQTLAGLIPRSVGGCQLEARANIQLIHLLMSLNLNYSTIYKKLE